VSPVFIVFEGIDGSGKSTQAGMFHAYLRSLHMDPILLMEPSTGEWGKKIRTLLSGSIVPPVEEMLELFLRDREDDSRRNIIPALDSKKSVVMDRYFHSNAAYQGAMGLEPDRILSENRRRSFPEPDRVYFIDIPPGTALRRISERNRGEHRDIFEKKTFMEKVREIFLAMADDTFLIIDGEKPEHEIHAMIIEDFQNRFDIFT